MKHCNKQSHAQTFMLSLTMYMNDQVFSEFFPREKAVTISFTQTQNFFLSFSNFLYYPHYVKIR